MPRRSGWEHLLEDPDFKRWYDNLARGSEMTARENARVLFRYLQHYKLTPSELVAIAQKDKKTVDDQLLDFVSLQTKEGKSPSYIENYIKFVKSWLKYNGIELVRSIKIGGTSRTPTIDDEKVPTKEELRQILGYSDERGKTSIALMSFTGLRPQVLGDYKGVDGLEMRDLPEVEVRDKNIVFTKTPTMVVVRASLSKAGHRYFSFLGEEGCEYLKAYLEKRIASGETIDQSSSVIAYKEGYGETGMRVNRDRSNRHITTKTLTKEIRHSMRPRFTWRPYVLRAYFDTQAMVAENNGRISHPYRQFFMGHKGDIEARYTVNKGKLPESVIEDMRVSYKRCTEYLETSKPTSPDEEKLKETFRKQLLLVAGFKEDEVETMDTSMSDEEFQQIVRRQLLGNPKIRSSQRVIPVSDVDKFLKNGFSYIATLPGGKVIVSQ